MFIENSVKINFDSKRITALWAFSEAALGGILHALKIPFKGIFIGCFAVIFITLIAASSNNKREILRSTIIVILVKAVISPHSTLTAFFAVLLQGILGYFFFSFFRSQRIASIFLGFFAMLFSAIQKLILLTLLFGNTLWESIDLFAEYILSQLGLDFQHKTISASYFLIILYISIHVSAGILAGLFAVDLPAIIENERYNFKNTFIPNQKNLSMFDVNKSKKRKKWFQKPTGMLFLLFLFVVSIISYFTESFDNNFFYDIIFMLVRLITILILWIYFISPFLMKSFSKVIDEKKFKYASEINKITVLFPDFKTIIKFCWNESANKNGIERIKKFLMTSLILLLTVEIDTKTTVEIEQD